MFGFSDDQDALAQEHGFVCLQTGKRPNRISALRRFLGDVELRTVLYIDSLPTDEELDAFKAYPEANIYVRKQ